MYMNMYVFPNHVYTHEHNIYIWCLHLVSSDIFHIWSSSPVEQTVMYFGAGKVHTPQRQATTDAAELPGNGRQQANSFLLPPLYLSKKFFIGDLKTE